MRDFNSRLAMSRHFARKKEAVTQELNMDRTRRAFIASLECEKEPDVVDAAVWALWQSVVDLIELRHKNATADRVMDEERMIRGSASALQGLLDDLWASKFSAKLEAAE